jgi:hypothetical protein
MKAIMMGRTVTVYGNTSWAQVEMSGDVWYIAYGPLPKGDQSLADTAYGAERLSHYIRYEDFPRTPEAMGAFLTLFVLAGESADGAAA